MVIAQEYTIPSNGSAITVITSTPVNSSSLAIRNTGTVTLLLGPVGNEVFPLAANEFLGISVAGDDVIAAVVQTAGTAGQLSVFGMN